TDSGHYRREAGDGASPQVVAVREAARQDDAVVGGEIAFPVPDEVRLVSHHFGERPLAVSVAPGAGENEDGEAHRFHYGTRNREQGTRFVNGRATTRLKVSVKGDRSARRSG